VYRALAPIAFAVVVGAACSAAAGIVAYCWCRGAWSHFKEAVMA
jgi:hypothetical protein